MKELYPILINKVEHIRVYPLFRKRLLCPEEATPQLQFHKVSRIVDTLESHPGLSEAAALSRGGTRSTRGAAPQVRAGQ